MEININLLLLGVIIIAGITVTTKIVLESLSFSHLINKKRLSLQNQYTKELEIDNDELRKQIKSMIASNNRKERGPQLEDGDLAEMITAFAGDLSGFLPKKLQPFFQDKDLQKGIINKVLEDPEKFRPLINKFIKPKGADKTQDPEGLSV